MKCPRCKENVNFDCFFSHEVEIYSLEYSMPEYDHIYFAQCHICSYKERKEVEAGDGFQGKKKTKCPFCEQHGKEI